MKAGFIGYYKSCFNHGRYPSRKLLVPDLNVIERSGEMFPEFFAQVH